MMNVVRVAPVPHPVFVPDVAQRVQVRVGLAMIRNAVVVRGQPTPRFPDSTVHEVLRRGRVVGRRGLGKLPAQRHRPSGLDQLGGGQALLIGHHVHGANLVVFSPASPIPVLFQVGQNFVFGRYSPFHYHTPSGGLPPAVRPSGEISRCAKFPPEGTRPGPRHFDRHTEPPPCPPDPPSVTPSAARGLNSLPNTVPTPAFPPRRKNSGESPTPPAKKPARP